MQENKLCSKIHWQISEHTHQLCHEIQNNEISDGL